MSPSIAVVLSTPLTLAPFTSFTPPRVSTRPAPELRFDLVKTGWLATMLGVAIVWGPGLASPGPIAAASLVLTFLTVCLGHSAGLHRGIIHRTYRCSRAVRNVLLYLFVLTGLGSPLSWMRLHALRDNAQNDTQSPPVFGYQHGLLRDFVINQILSFRLDDARKQAAVAEELRDDRYIRFLSWTWPLHQVLLAGVLWLAGGRGYVVCAVCGRVAITILGHWFVGYVAHTHGSRPFRIEGVREEGTNVPVLGVLSFGEGWHNNHHAFPDSARFGLFPGQLDLGYLALRGMERLGLVRDIRTAPNVPARPGVRLARSGFAW